MRIGIFGGTFDPIHLGHLILAERCRDLAQLDQVWFLPSYVPPHKAVPGMTRFEHRCDMVSLAITGQSAFRMDPIEKELPPPSYTAETLGELKTRYPQAEFSLILGADSVRDLPTWHDPQRVVQQAGIIAVARTGIDTLTQESLAQQLGLAVTSLKMQLVSCPLIEIASRDLRQMVSSGQSIRYLVPRSVEEFIRERKLYLPS